MLKINKLLKRIKELNPNPIIHKDINHTVRVLKFLEDRLIEVHKENPNCDYMIHFKSIIKEIEQEALCRKSMQMLYDFVSECGTSIHNKLETFNWNEDNKIES